jgi:uncharacterized tellurite resistance protein B-like protein
MMFLDIFGTRGIPSTRDEGDFYCPVCHGPCGYEHKRVRKFFTLYFFPVIPLGAVGEYVECQECRGTFPSEVLELSPQAAVDEYEAVFEMAVRRLLVEMALADQFLTFGEFERVSRLYQKLTGQPIEKEAVAREIRRAELDDRNVTEFLEDVAFQLNEEGKERVLEAALAVAAADGLIRDEEREMVQALGEALEMTPSQVRDVLGSASTPR